MVSWLSAEAAPALYEELRAKAPRLVADAGWRTSVEFTWWSRQEPVFLVRYPEAVVMVTHWYRALSAEVHPVIWDWRSVRTRVPWFLGDLMEQLGVGRLVLPMKWKSRTAVRALAGAGAVREGTARKSTWSHSTGVAELIDVELWAILREDLRGVDHGNE